MPHTGQECPETRWPGMENRSKEMPRNTPARDEEQVHRNAQKHTGQRVENRSTENEMSRHVEVTLHRSSSAGELL